MEMRSLVSAIEAYLKELLRASPDGRIEVQRRDVAEQFSCVPSQITYVVNTRFDTRHGYLVESRRGGGGYIRICRLYLNQEQEGKPDSQIAEGVAAEQRTNEGSDEAREVLYTLARRGFFNEREFLLLNLVFQVVESHFPGREGDELKGQVMREIIAESGLS